MGIARFYFGLILGCGRNLMKRSVAMVAVALAALLGVTLLPNDGQAHGCRHACYGPSCDYCVQYVAQTVTRYRPVYADKDYTEVVCKTVTKEVPYTYTVNVPVITPTKQV